MVLLPVTEVHQSREFYNRSFNYALIPTCFSSSFSEVTVIFEVYAPEMCRSDLTVVVNP